MRQRNEGQFSKRNETPSAEHPGSFGTLVHKRWRSTTQRATRCMPMAHRGDVHELRAGSNCNIPDPRTVTLRPVHNTESKHHANNVHPAAPNKHHKRPLSLKECRCDTSSPTGAERLCKHTSHNKLPTGLATRQPDTWMHYPAPMMQLYAKNGATTPHRKSTLRRNSDAASGDKKQTHANQTADTR